MAVHIENNVLAVKFVLSVIPNVKIHLWASLYVSERFCGKLNERGVVFFSCRCPLWDIGGVGKSGLAVFIYFCITDFNCLVMEKLMTLLR